MKTLSILFLLFPSLALAAGNSGASKSAKESAAVPTRFLADSVDDRIAEMKQQLAINNQERGPFGLYQVPGKAPIIRNSVAKKVTKTPFSDFVNDIEISVVNSVAKEFLVGARIFRLGQVFPLVRGGEKLSVRVESIATSGVSFKNVDTGEIATRRLDVLPPGVRTADNTNSVPGVTPVRRAEAEPLDLSSSSPPSLR